VCTYSSIGSLLLLVPLLVSGGLGLIRSTLLVGERLPLLAEELANLAWMKMKLSAGVLKLRGGAVELTELDAGVVLANLLALVVGEEHVGGETALGSIGVCSEALAC
jgi:hypothetical protein